MMILILAAKWKTEIAHDNKTEIRRDKKRIVQKNPKGANVISHEKKEKNQCVFWSQSDKDHSKSCLGRVENGKSRENKPFHQHRVKYDGYEAQIKYPHNAACWCITLAVTEASDLATGQTSSTRQIWCLKRIINLSHRASGPHLAQRARNK